MEQRTIFGTMPDGRDVECITLAHGPLSCRILTYGGALQALIVPDRDGKPTDVVLGFDTLDTYLHQDKYLGALIGRYANRIGGACFTLNGKKYVLNANDGKNHLHGGPGGFDKKLWTVEALTEDSLTLSLFSPDGDEGYPGDLNVTVTYQLTEDALAISYEAQSSEDTVCNLTNHAYFNLSGHDSGPVTGQYIQISARFYTPTDGASIPHGAIAPVDRRPMDLTSPKPIGARVDEDFPQLMAAGGYDHNWVLEGQIGTLRPAARCWSPDTGILMEALTTQPGIQFYSGNHLDGCPAGKGGAPYARRWGFCLETQAFPNSPNCPHFPSAILRRGDVYRQQTVYRFGTDS